MPKLCLPTLGPALSWEYDICRSIRGLVGRTRLVRRVEVDVDAVLPCPYPNAGAGTQLSSRGVVSEEIFINGYLPDFDTFERAGTYLDVRDKARHYHHNNSVHTWHLRTYPRRMQMFELAEVTTREQASSVLRRRWLQKYLGVGIRRRASRRFMIMISAISYHTRWVLTRLTADDGPHSLEIRRVSCDVTWP